MCYPALSTHHLTKAFAGKTAVQSCSLSVAQGSIYGFLGRNGAGKTSAPFFLFAAGRIAGGVLPSGSGCAKIQCLPPLLLRWCWSAWPARPAASPSLCRRFCF